MALDGNQPTRDYRFILVGIGVLVFALSIALGLLVLSEPIQRPSTQTPSPFASEDTTSPARVAVVSETPTASPEPTAPPTAEPPTPSALPATPTATATPCVPAPPPGWVLHVVQPGDTVFDLAVSRGTTIDEVPRVNCLSSPHEIIVGQTLYLPPLPPSPTPSPTPTQPPPSPTSPPPEPTEPPPPAPPTPTATPCSVFSCQSGDLPPLVLAPGGPDDPTFIPCNPDVPTPTPRATPWVHTSAPFVVEWGVRRYFFACDFPTSPISANVELSDGSIQQVGLLTSIPNPDLPMGRAQAIVEWPALPTQPTGFYTLTITSGDGSQAQRIFIVRPPAQEHILPVPAAGLPGTTFQVYYVNFALNSTPTFDFYGEDQPVRCAQHMVSHRGRWQILIDQPLAGTSDRGWAQQSLISLSTDRPATYAIYYNFYGVYNLIWLQETSVPQPCQTSTAAAPR